MAAGDFKVMRNASNTDTVPTAGSDLLLLWDTAVSNTGTGITYSAGTFTLGETGHFLVMCSDQIGTTDITANERIGAKQTFTLGGTELIEGYSTVFIRKTSGAQEGIFSSMAIINVTTTTGNGDELQVRQERIDDSTAGSPARIPDRSGITIVKLDDNNDFARYTGAATTTATSDGSSVVMDLSTTVEEDATFTRTGNAIDVASNNLVLVSYSVRSEDATPTALRQEFQAYVLNNSTTVRGTLANTYIRYTDNCIWGGCSGIGVYECTSGDDITLEIISRESGGCTFDAALQLWELPTGTEGIITQATTGDYNTAATNFSWDTVPYIDTAAFTHTAGNANLDVDNADDYLVFAGVGTTTGEAAIRAVPASAFRVNTTDVTWAGTSAFHRNTGTAKYSAMSLGTMLAGLSASDSVYMRNDRLGTTTTPINNNIGGMQMLRLSSLIPAAATTISMDLMTVAATMQTVTINENLGGASWAAALNTRYIVDDDTNVRIRFLIKETGGVAAANQQFQLQYNLESGGWNDVTGASTVARATATTEVADGADTTQILGAGTFVTPNSGFDEADGEVGSGTDMDFAGSDEVELEFCVQLRSADVDAAEVVQFRIVEADATVLGTYTEYAELQVTPIPETITVDLATVAIANQTVNINAGTLVAMDLATVAVSTQNPVVLFPEGIAIDLMTVSVSNQTVNINAVEHIVIDLATVAVTNQSPNINAATAIAMDLATVTTSMQAVTLIFATGETISIDLATVTTNTLAANINAATAIAIDLATVAVTMQSINLNAVEHIVIDLMTTAVTTQAVNLNAATAVAMDLATVTATMQLANLNAVEHIVIDLATVAVTTQAANINAKTLCAVDLMTVVTTLVEPNVSGAESVVIDLMTVAVTNQAVTLNAREGIAIDLASVAVSMQAATLNAAVNLAVDLLTVTVATQAANVNASEGIAIDLLSVSVTPLSVGINAATTIATDLMTTVVTMLAVNLNARESIVVDLATVSVSMQSTSVVMAESVVIDLMTVDVTTYTAALIQSITLAMDLMTVGVQVQTLNINARVSIGIDLMSVSVVTNSVDLIAFLDAMVITVGSPTFTLESDDGTEIVLQLADATKSFTIDGRPQVTVTLGDSVATVALEDSVATVLIGDSIATVTLPTA